MIEKNLHFIWDKGYEAMPQEYKKNVSSWNKYHPEWTVYFWDKKGMDNLVLTHYPEFKKLWKSCGHIMEFIDIVKFIILHRYGGLYVDTDIECLRTYPDKFLQKDFVVSKMYKDDFCKGDGFCFPVYVTTLGQSSSMFLNSGFYGGKKGSAFLHSLVQKIEKERKTCHQWMGQEMFIAGTGGPTFITKMCVKEQWDKNPNIQILKSEFMEPCGLNYGVTKDRKDCGITKNTIGVHMHQLSWATPFMKNCMKVYYYRKYVFWSLCILMIIVGVYLYRRNKEFTTWTTIVLGIAVICMYFNFS